MPKGNRQSGPPVALVKAAFLQQFKTAMENNHVPIEPYFKKLRLPLVDMYDPEAFLPEKPFWQLINQIAIAEMIPDFGMQVAQVTPWYQVESIQKLINKNQSLKALLDSFCEITPSQSNVTSFKLHTENALCWFEYSGQPLISNDIQMELYRVTSMIELVQLAAGKNWRPLKVRLMMDKNRVVEKNNILNDCELLFSQAHTAIAFPAGLLNATIISQTNTRPTHLAGDDSRKLNEIQDKSELVNALREIISFYITEENLSIEVIADIAGLSTRSLQRMMKKHGISYNALLNAARQQYAETKLVNSASKISDIAYQLGYNDTAHFTRAFKRWTGMSPSVYRKSSE
jgi:AraC-like DNA-binding protein